jgi:hypothetical protein
MNRSGITARISERSHHDEWHRIEKDFGITKEDINCIEGVTRRGNVKYPACKFEVVAA